MMRQMKRAFLAVALCALMATLMCSCESSKPAQVSASIESVAIKYSDNPNNPNLSKASSQYYTTTVKLKWTNSSGKPASFNDLCKLRAFTEAGTDLNSLEVQGGNKTIGDGESQNLTATITKPIAPSPSKGGRIWTFEVLEKNTELKSFTASKNPIANYTYTFPLDAIPNYQRGIFS